jgi:hypothetical protein
LRTDCPSHSALLLLLLGLGFGLRLCSCCHTLLLFSCCCPCCCSAVLDLLLPLLLLLLLLLSPLNHAQPIEHHGVVISWAACHNMQGGKRQWQCWWPGLSS